MPCSGPSAIPRSGATPVVGDHRRHSGRRAVATADPRPPPAARADAAEDARAAPSHLWQHVAAFGSGLGLVERLIVGCLVIVAAFVPFVWWGAGVDPTTDPMLRPGWFEAGYAILCGFGVAWVALLGWLLSVRRGGRAPAGAIYAAGLLYATSNALFALGIGWDTGPWVPLILVGIAAAGFVGLDRPRETWTSLAVAYAVLLAGIAAESAGLVPHAFVLAMAPNQGGRVGAWWHLLVGAHTLVMCGLLFVFMRYVVVRWRQVEGELAERNGLLRHVFGRYMSAEVMRTLLDNPDDALSLGGQQREVTLLMSHLRGFGAVAERLEPAELVGLLNDYFEVMVDVCLAHRGTINEIIGDGMLVVFGAPEACADHTDRALRCARAMQAAMELVDARNVARGRPTLAMAIGVEAGPVVVGNIGSSKRTKYGVVGSTVNRTARIGSYAEGGQVVTSAATLARAEGPVEASDAFEVRPKGGAPLTLHIVEAVAPGEGPTVRAPSAAERAGRAPAALDQPAGWRRLLGWMGALGIMDRALLGCLVIVTAFVPLVVWGAGVDASTHPAFRTGGFEAGYVFLCACFAVWIGLTLYVAHLRRRGRTYSRVFHVNSVLYAIQNTLFAFAIGWDTSPWLPLILFGVGCFGFVWIDTPREAWTALAVGYLITAVGIVAEAAGWLPHAFVLESSPNRGGVVDPWWHVLIGAQALLVSGITVTLIHHAARQWRLGEQAVSARNDLLRHMFGRYMSTEVMRALLDDPEEALDLGGQQREVSLLMSDLRGFTALAERLTPPQVIALLNDYFDVMVDVCLDHRGTINEIIGDALLVVFGAPTPCDDHADRAVACAIAMQRAMGAVNARNRDAGRPQLEMGIGVNTGLVVVGNIGSSKRTRYGVIGPQVDRTARIESYTVGGQIIATQAVLDAARAEVGVAERLVVGEDDPMTLHLIEAIGAPFDLRLPPMSDTPRALDPPRAIRLAILSGKHVGAETFAATVVGLGERVVRIETEAPPAVFDNVEIILRAPELRAIYAKVVGASAGAVTLRITALPPAAEERMRRWARGV